MCEIFSEWVEVNESHDKTNQPDGAGVERDEWTGWGRRGAESVLLGGRGM